MTGIGARIPHHHSRSLLGVAVDQPPAAGSPVGVVAGVTPFDVVGDGLVVAAGELGGRAVTPGEAERFEYLHDLLVGLGHGSPPA
jgi:hypothetical protein